MASGRDLLSPLKQLRPALAFVAAVVILALGAPTQAGAFTVGGEPCKLIEVPTAAAPLGAGSCPGVRPGAVVESEVGQCTMNFLFGGADGRRYMGTAGHCILGEGSLGGQDAGERTWAPGSGPVARDAHGNRIGEFAYAVLSDPKDFALIRLDPGVPASAQMCHFGGPTGVNSDRGSAPVVLNHYGAGILVGEVLPARSALALGMPSADELLAHGVASPGDSGGPIRSADGRAVGVVVAVGVALRGGQAGPMIVTRLAPQEARAEQVLGTTLTLQTAAAL